MGARLRFAAFRYTGLETIEADVAGEDLTVFATDGDDTVEVTPLTATSGVLQANGVDPVLNYSNLDVVITFLVDLLTGGEDRLVVYGNSTGETITVTPTTVTASGQPVNYANAEALTVDGQEGSDTFNVTASEDTEIFIDGGDPIGITGDKLVLFAPSAAKFAPGPEADEGGFAFTDELPVSYDHIEGVELDLQDNDLGVSGTNADDDIKVLGTGTTSYWLSVNAGPAIVVTNSGGLTVDGLHGDDDIDIDVRGLDLPSLTVKGNNPSVEGDTLTVEGVLGRRTVRRGGRARIDGGILDVGAQTITVQTMERLIYDGDGEIENLTVVLPAGVNQASFEYDAFASVGVIQVKNVGLTASLQPLLGIEFQDVGLDVTSGAVANGVIIDGTAGGDTLFYRGRSEIDQMQVTAAGVINDLLNLSPDVTTSGVEDLVLLGGAGNDAFDIASDHPYISIIVTGDGSDAGATADANGDQVLVRGVARAETITVKPNPYIDSETYISGHGRQPGPEHFDFGRGTDLLPRGPGHQRNAERPVDRRSGSGHAYGAGGRRPVHGLADGHARSVRPRDQRFAAAGVRRPFGHLAGGAGGRGCGQCRGDVRHRRPDPSSQLRSGAGRRTIRW